ncbi:MAG: glycerophosphodiester phosphodiesterase [Propionibacteriaceae bacterium]|jgi:glycerophosphoryl diester phosphodiesterase|nr:glycerophosphodiester phosphodiesterase [Propionibacteriaceae bacterium]
MVKIWAHRGARRQAPENTLAAFQAAVELGADGVELDVQLTADGQLVVFHDERLERLTDGRGLVRDHTLAELKQLRVAGPPVAGADTATIPTLADVFILLAGTGLEINVEIKDAVVFYDHLADQVSQLIDDFELGPYVTLSSFNHCSLAQLRRHGSMARTGVLFTDILYEPWVYGAQLWATALHPHFRYVDYVADLVDSAHAAQLEVNVWTVNQPADIQRMIDLGVDAIITDEPEQALALCHVAQPDVALEFGVSPVGG